MQRTILVLFLLCCHACASAQDFQQVDRIVDGDTFVLVGGERVRLIGVDTPETVHPHEPPEPFGKEASEWLASRLDSKRVRLEFDAQERDRYGRLLAYVYLEDGTFVNAELLRLGLATIMTIPPNVKHADEFYQIQKEAREEKRGMWANDQ